MRGLGWDEPPHKPLWDDGSKVKFYAALGGGAKAESEIWYADYVAAVGLQGWELVSIDFTARGDREFWFKRPAR